MEGFKQRMQNQAQLVLLIRKDLFVYCEVKCLVMVTEILECRSRNIRGTFSTSEERLSCDDKKLDSVEKEE